MTPTCLLFPNWNLINILNAQCIHAMTFITKWEQAISRHVPWQCFNLVHYTAIILHINEISYKRGKSCLWRSTPRQKDRQKRGKAPSASSSSAYIHYPCHSGMWLAWLNYGYIVINHVTLFIFIQHQSIYNPEGREAVGAVPGLRGVICWITMHTAEWGTGTMLSWLFQLSLELWAVDLIVHPDTALLPNANTITEIFSLQTLTLQLAKSANTALSW